MSWLVLLRHQNGRAVPMTVGAEDNDAAYTVWDVAHFDTEEEAHEAARENMLGQTFGYELVEWDE